MSYELITMIVGFLSRAFILNRNTETLRKKVGSVARGHQPAAGGDAKRDAQRFRRAPEAHRPGLRRAPEEDWKARPEHAGGIKQSRTEINRRFDEANTEGDRRWNRISHDRAEPRECIARVEQSNKRLSLGKVEPDQKAAEPTQDLPED